MPIENTPFFPNPSSPASPAPPATTQPAPALPFAKKLLEQTKSTVVSGAMAPPAPFVNTYSRLETSDIGALSPIPTTNQEKILHILGTLEKVIPPKDRAALHPLLSCISSFVNEDKAVPNEPPPLEKRYIAHSEGREIEVIQSRTTEMLILKKSDAEFLQDHPIHQEGQVIFIDDSVFETLSTAVDDILELFGQIRAHYTEEQEKEEAIKEKLREGQRPSNRLSLLTQTATKKREVHTYPEKKKISFAEKQNEADRKAEEDHNKLKHIQKKDDKAAQIVQTAIEHEQKNLHHT